MTKIKMSNQQESGATNGNDFIERRRSALERYLKRTAEHPVLVLDPDFREFLESGNKTPIIYVFLSLPHNQTFRH